MTEGARVALRPVAEADLNLLESWDNDADMIGEYNTFALRPSRRLRRSFAERGLLDDENGTLLVITREGERIGTVSYRQTAYGPGASNRVFDIGIALIAGQRGKGYGVEAQRLLAAYLFSAHAIERVEATTDITNLPEQRALERAGFTREGVLRRAQFRAGAWHDLVIYSKLRGE